MGLTHEVLTAASDKQWLWALVVCAHSVWLAVRSHTHSHSVRLSPRPMGRISILPPLPTLALAKRLGAEVSLSRPHSLLLLAYYGNIRYGDTTRWKKPGKLSPSPGGQLPWRVA